MSDLVFIFWMLELFQHVLVPFVFSHLCLSTGLHFERSGSEDSCLTLIRLLVPTDTCWIMWLSLSVQASCCLTCLSLTRGESFTRYWRCSVTGCTTSSRTTESSCWVICTVWLLCPRPTRISCIYGNVMWTHTFTYIQHTPYKITYTITTITTKTQIKLHSIQDCISEQPLQYWSVFLLLQIMKMIIVLIDMNSYSRCLTHEPCNKCNARQKHPKLHRKSHTIESTSNIVFVSPSPVLRAQLCGWSQPWGVQRYSPSSPASSTTQRQFCQPSLKSWTEPWSSPWQEPHTSLVL